jgi:hypothetical protein
MALSLLNLGATHDSSHRAGHSLSRVDDSLLKLLI